MIDIILNIFVALLTLGAFWYYFKSKEESGAEKQDVVTSIVSGTQETKSKAYIPKSLNQKEGLTFSYTCWLKIDNFSYKYGQQKVIFTKGASDLSTMCPGVFLDGNTNTILVKIDTFGGQEIIPINNIPAKKWIHFGLVVDQNSVDVYINGIVHTHRSIVNLPRQNPDSVRVGLDGGFEGKISNLQYYNYFITPEQMKTLLGDSPIEKNAPDNSVANFDYRWWTRRSL